MARGTMHSPKPDGQRRRRNAPTHGEIVLSRDDKVRGPELVGPYSEQTLAWYEVWRRSPQAAVFETTDWQRLAILAPIMDAYFKRPSAAALSEIRMNEERLGATVTDRMRARMRIEADAPEATNVEPGGAVPISSAPSARAALRDRMASGE